MRVRRGSRASDRDGRSLRGRVPAGLSRAGATSLAVALGYACGTFSTADVVTRRLGASDLRREGSGNPGAANAMNVLGARAGLVVLAGDILKGVVASAAGGVVGGPAGARLAGTAAVVGHCHPPGAAPGGKGVATSAGQCLATFPAYFPIDVAVAAAVAAVPSWKERAHTAVVVSSTCWVVGGMLWWRRGWPNGWGGRPGITLPLSALVSSVVIIERFRSARPSTPPPPPGHRMVGGAVIVDDDVIEAAA